MKYKIDNELHNFLNGSYTDDPSVAKAYEELFRLKELNGIYDILLSNYGLQGYKIPKTGEGFNINLRFKPINVKNPNGKDKWDDFIYWKLSCRGYNRFCDLWGEKKSGQYEHDGHQFNEDEVEASRAFGTPAFHWDRKASIWNVYLGVKNGIASNYDIHSESIKKVAEMKGITLTPEEVKEARGISKILTFRVMFGGGMRAAVHHFNSTLSGHGDTDGIIDARKAMDLCIKYNLASNPEELIKSYYDALESLNIIDRDFKKDQTKDITVFYVESAVYIFMALWLWNHKHVRTLLKYDSFFTDKEVTDEEFMEAIQHSMNMFKKWRLPSFHTELDSRLWDGAQGDNAVVDEVVMAMGNGFDITYQSISDHLRMRREEGLKCNITPAKICKELGVGFNSVDQTRAAREAAKEAAALSHHNKVIERMKSLVGKKGLTGAEMVAKSSFKKKYPAEFNAIFGD